MNNVDKKALRDSIYHRIIEISSDELLDYSEVITLWNQNVNHDLELNSAFKYYLPEFQAY